MKVHRRHPTKKKESKENLSNNMERNRSETFTSHNDKTRIIQTTQYNHSERKNPFELYDHLWKTALRIIYSILGIFLLTATILPTVLVYLLVSNTNTSQTEQLQTISVYRNHCSGISPYTLWTINSTYTVTMQVNTSRCHFTDTPLYFVSITGTSTHYCLSGYNAIYLATKDSFQIYAQYTCGVISSSTLLSYTQTYLYNIDWIGFYKEELTY